jgi:hypothetical protein
MVRRPDAWSLGGLTSSSSHDGVQQAERDLAGPAAGGRGAGRGNDGAGTRGILTSSFRYFRWRRIRRALCRVSFRVEHLKHVGWEAHRVERAT